MPFALCQKHFVAANEKERVMYTVTSYPAAERGVDCLISYGESVISLATSVTITVTVPFTMLEPTSTTTTTDVGAVTINVSTIFRCVTDGKSGSPPLSIIRYWLRSNENNFTA